MRVIDVECYSNYALLMWKDMNTGAIGHLEQYPGRPFDLDRLQRVLTETTTVGFNSLRYDLPILRLALTGASCAALKSVSDEIIKNNLAPWKVPGWQGNLDHIDIMEPTPGVQVSLKSYAGRIHAPRMQDLPIDPSASIAPEQRVELRRYCANDLDVTERLYRTIEDRIKLREDMGKQYGIDLRSKSDAQIAEAVIKHAMGGQIERPEIRPGTMYRYRSPAFLRFETDALKAVHAKIKQAVYVVNKDGAIDLPDELATLKITIGGSTYQLGIGGLHSTEKSTAHHADAQAALIDADVASFYPSIIVRCGYYPKHMGAKFLDVYSGIIAERIAAKRSGNKTVNEGLKIVLNGSYGKFGSKWSVLYSPDLMIQTTLTGQLSLLMLIEALEQVGVPVVSANTDGIVIKCPRQRLSQMRAVISLWEYFTAFEMEQVEYRALYSKDVNNYIAVKTDGSVKLKGLYAPAGLMKNPTNAVVVDSVVAHLTQGADVRHCIESCRDITRFVTIRSVKGGGVQGERYLGKTVRWYYSPSGAPITYKSNGNKVAKSEGARAMMELPGEFPNDIDYGRYVKEAEEILRVIGANKCIAQN